jgi:hypothetical protein
VKDWRTEEPDNLFPTPQDAALYLAGLAGFWGGIGALLIAVAAAAPSLAVAAISVLAIASMFVTMRAIRKLEGRITGRVVRPWPFGYPSLRIQVTATLPSTVMAAAQKLNFHAAIVAMAMYSLLIIDFFALVAIWAAKR